jgi:hypothetical protein
VYLHRILQAALLVCALIGREGARIDRRLLTSSRAVEGLVDCDIVSTEAAVAEVEATALDDAGIVHVLCVGCGGVAGEETCGELGPGAADTARPQVIVRHSTTHKAIDIDEVL